MQAQFSSTTPTAQIAREVAADYHPATTAAFRLGAYSAQLQEICCPEMVFLFLHDRQEFARGYASVAGATLTTVQILGGKLL